MMGHTFHHATQLTKYVYLGVMVGMEMILMTLSNGSVFSQQLSHDLEHHHSVLQQIVIQLHVEVVQQGKFWGLVIQLEILFFLEALLLRYYLFACYFRMY